MRTLRVLCPSRFWRSCCRPSPADCSAAGRSPPRIRSSNSIACSRPRSRAIDRDTSRTSPSDRLVYGAIDGMLQTLDPHSSFFDPKQYAQMRERQEGRYYGLGISIQVIDGDITVMSLFEGSPAYAPASAAATSSRASRRRTPRTGPASRRSRKLQGPEGHQSQHRHPPSRVRQADRHGRRARRSQHHHRPRRAS